MAEKIELTPQELEEIKDTIKFRECVILKLKELKGVPKKVTVLETKVGVHHYLIGAMIMGVIGLAWRVLMK